MAAIYYLIDKESETGKKITELKEKIDWAKSIRKEVLSKLGQMANVEIDHYQSYDSFIVGRPVSFTFPSNPNPEV